MFILGLYLLSNKVVIMILNNKDIIKVLSDVNFILVDEQTYLNNLPNGLKVYSNIVQNFIIYRNIDKRRTWIVGKEDRDITKTHPNMVCIDQYLVSDLLRPTSEELSYLDILYGSTIVKAYTDTLAALRAYI